MKVELFKVIKTNVYKIELKGGRSNSYDFLLMNGDDLLKLELKYNADRIDKCPQFLNISAINFIKGEDYASYYYDNYLDRFMNPTTDFYEGIEKSVRRKYFLFGEKITITKHKYYVMKFCFKCGLYKRGVLHDLSKYSFIEFFSSAKYPL